MANKTETVSLRMDAATSSRLKEKAKALGLSASAYLRQLLDNDLSGSSLAENAVLSKWEALDIWANARVREKAYLVSTRNEVYAYMRRSDNTVKLSYKATVHPLVAAYGLGNFSITGMLTMSNKLQYVESQVDLPTMSDGDRDIFFSKLKLNVEAAIAYIQSLPTA
jgi:hypothetical protein